MRLHLKLNHKSKKSLEGKEAKRFRHLSRLQDDINVGKQKDGMIGLNTPVVIFLTCIQIVGDAMVAQVSFNSVT